MASRVFPFHFSSSFSSSFCRCCEVSKQKQKRERREEQPHKSLDQKILLLSVSLSVLLPCLAPYRPYKTSQTKKHWRGKCVRRRENAFSSLGQLRGAKTRREEISFCHLVCFVAVSSSSGMKTGAALFLRGSEMD